LGTIIEKNVNSVNTSFEAILSQALEHPEYKGYFIHPSGLVLSTRSNKILKPSRTGSGKRKYMFVVIRKDGRSIPAYVHRLVAFTFIPNPQGKPQVNHMSGDTFDNSAVNLEWVTPQENSAHAHANNLSLKGATCPWAKLTEALVRQVCELLQCGADSASIRKATGIGSKGLCKIKARTNWCSVSVGYVF
jgi:HNH endonuclease